MCRIKHCGNNFHIEKKKCRVGLPHVHKDFLETEMPYTLYIPTDFVSSVGFTSGFIMEKHQLRFMFQVFFFCFFLRIPRGADAVNYLVQCFPTVFCSSNGGLESADILVADTALLPASAINPLLRGVWCEIHLAQIPAESLSSH